MQFQDARGTIGLSTSGPKDARKIVRYTLRAKAIFTWKDRAEVQSEGRGETRDISPKGAYIVSGRCPPRGAAVAITIYLPMLEGESRILSIEAEGRVTRVEPSSISGDFGGFSLLYNRVALCTE